MLYSEEKPKLLEQTAHFSAFYTGIAEREEELETLLADLKQDAAGQLICLLGPRKQEDEGQRKNIGITAAKYTDRVILTEDPGCGDDFDEAIKQIQTGVESFGGSCMVIRDRIEAIHFLLDQSGREDTVLLLRRQKDDHAAILTDEQIVEQYLETK